MHSVELIKFQVLSLAMVSFRSSSILYILYLITFGHIRDAHDRQSASSNLSLRLSHSAAAAPLQDKGQALSRAMWCETCARPAMACTSSLHLYKDAVEVCAMVAGRTTANSLTRDNAAALVVRDEEVLQGIRDFLSSRDLLPAQTNPRHCVRGRTGEV